MAKKFHGLVFDTEHCCTSHRRKLDCSLSDLAVGPTNQDIVPWLDAASFPQTFKGGYEGNADRACFFHGKIDRFFADSGLWQGHILGVRTVLSDAEFSASSPDFLADQMRWSINNNACKIATGNSWPNRMGHMAERRLHV